MDFSHVIFILTANEIFHILEPLKNRLEIIAIPGYIEEEKMAIAKGYILPQVLNEAGVDDSMLKFNQKALLQIIKGWCYYENGVRELKRCLQRISRKAITEVLQKLPEKTGATVVSDTDFLNEVKAELYPENAEKKEKQSKIYNSDVLFNSPSFVKFFLHFPLYLKLSNKISWIKELRL